MGLQTPALLHASMDASHPIFDIDWIIILSRQYRKLDGKHQVAMTISQQINKCFLKLTAERCYQNIWFGDEAWRQILANHFNLDKLNKTNINRALFNFDLSLPLRLLKHKKRVMKQDNKCIHAYFYCISDGSKPNEELYNNIDWQRLYFNFNLPTNKRKWQEEDGECDINGGKCLLLSGLGGCLFWVGGGDGSVLVPSPVCFVLYSVIYLFLCF